jgi:hypothetical protein
MNTTIHAADSLAARQAHELSWECEALRRHAERADPRPSTPRRRGATAVATIRRLAYTTGTLAVFAVFTLIRPIAAALSRPID